MSRRHSNGAAKRRADRTRLRYFCISAVWGFGVGIATLAAAAHLAGTPLRLSPGMASLAIPGALLALAGGAAAAGAYKQARRRGVSGSGRRT